MKTRLGFVSNSSSSSCVLTGVSVPFKEVQSLVSGGVQVWCSHDGGGLSGDCADFVFQVTPERLQLMLDYADAIEHLSRRILFVAKAGAESLWRTFGVMRDYSSPPIADDNDEDGIRHFLEWIEYRIAPYSNNGDKEQANED